MSLMHKLRRARMSRNRRPQDKFMTLTCSDEPQLTFSTCNTQAGSLELVTRQVPRQSTEDRTFYI